MIKKVIEAIERHPAVRFGLPLLAVVGSTLLLLFGNSFFGSLHVYIAIGVILLLTGYFCGWKVLGLVVVLSITLILTVGPTLVVPRVQWSESTESMNPLLFHSYDEADLIQLRSEFRLDDLISGIDDEFEQVAVLAGWVNSRWSHSGSNMPSSSNPLVILREAAQGASFRCVEYSLVMVGVAQAMGMPARVVGLKTRWAATARSAAGHVVAEIWLDSYEKWAVVDPQFGYLFWADGVPLNAVELGEAMAQGVQSFEIVSAAGSVNWLNKTIYTLFAGPYLFHFDLQYDQRIFLPSHQRVGGGVMLVPDGAPELKVFQRKYALYFDRYISSVDAFYLAPEQAP